MKSLNEDKQMRSDWSIPICSGKERLKSNGAKVHSTQKPETLLSRIILSSTIVGDIVLDPFSGTATTAVIAKKFGRNWVCIEKDQNILMKHKKGIEKTDIERLENLETMKSKKIEPRVPFGSLVEKGLINPGEVLFDGRQDGSQR